MHGEGEHRIVTFEQHRRSVALVHVQVHHRRAVDETFELEQTDRHRVVVEDAVAFAVIGERVVRAARQVSRDAVAKGGARRGDGAVHRRSRPVHELLAPGEAQPADGVFAQTA